MKLRIWALLVVFPFACSAFGEKNDNDAEASRERQQYLVTLSEYQLTEDLPPTASEADVLEAVLSTGMKPVETIRIAAASEIDSMVQFGKSVSVPMGSTTSGKALSERTQQVELGTILRVTVASHASGAIADIDYSTSRLSSDVDDDSPPEILTHTVNSGQVYEFGKPRLLSTETVSEGSCVIIIVQSAN